MQRERRRDPYPWTWEIPLAVVMVVVLEMLTGVQLGRSLANLAVGAGWTWPAEQTGASQGPFASPVGSAFWTSLPGIIGGDPGAGLAASAPADLAGSGLLWVSLSMTELALLVATAGLGVWSYHRWGPGRMRGMATAAEAEKLLGVTRLRSTAAVVRPDLYSSRSGSPLTHRRAADDTSRDDRRVR